MRKIRECREIVNFKLYRLAQGILAWVSEIILIYLLFYIAQEPANALNLILLIFLIGANICLPVFLLTYFSIYN